MEIEFISLSTFLNTNSLSHAIGTVSILATLILVGLVKITTATESYCVQQTNFI